jgi:hypothetical protein
VGGSIRGDVSDPGGGRVFGVSRGMGKYPSPLVRLVNVRRRMTAQPHPGHCEHDDRSTHNVIPDRVSLRAEIRELSGSKGRQNACRLQPSPGAASTSPFPSTRMDPGSAVTTVVAPLAGMTPCRESRMRPKRQRTPTTSSRTERA